MSSDHDQARTIRTGRHEDLAAILDLYRHLNPKDPLLAPGHAEEVWSDLLSRKGVEVLLAEKDGQAVATCTVIIIPNLTRGARPYALIENVVTHAEYRTQGHGRAILRAALDRAWDADCYKTMLLTGRKDEAVRSFYEGAGFRGDVKTGFHASPPSNMKGQP